jgi:hypothetical protein
VVEGVAFQRSDLLCVVCGSVASWMIQKILASKVGIHNRAICRIRLMPFQSAETREYLQLLRVDLPDFQIAPLQIVLGRVPHYLQRFEPGRFVWGHRLLPICGLSGPQTVEAN